jgi:cytosine/uracil/thiamine/allantoin permease
MSHQHSDIVELTEDISASHLWSKDLAPVPKNDRTWSMWNLAALWVGMAVCIPTYLLASYMIKGGMSWLESLIIIGVANLIITLPMVLNGHAGVKYGIPFPVIGRSSFGTKGIHLPAIVRALVACGWFGIQTWIGGLAIYAIFNALTGNEGSLDLTFGKFVSFGIFWLINLYFIWKGTESIKFLEQYSAPILILMGILLIGWGAKQADGFGIVLDQSKQLSQPTASWYKDNGNTMLEIHPLKYKDGNVKATDFRIRLGDDQKEWQPINRELVNLGPIDNSNTLNIQFRNKGINKESSVITVSEKVTGKKALSSRLWDYILWLTIMVGFWATMSLSIADITRYAATQKAQVTGQFIGLPGTMMLYSFVGIFVTCAAIINFDDILIGDDAPWDPVSLLSKFESPTVVIISQVFMLIATLSTNIAANVIAPSNAFSNLWPQKISFRTGGIITGIIGIIICPWFLMDQISNVLIFVSGLLGPVLGIMLCDYYSIRKTNLDLDELYKQNGIYSFNGGFNYAAMVALALGVFIALIGYYIPSLSALYSLSWFSGFFVSFIVYYILMRKAIKQ